MGRSAIIAFIACVGASLCSGTTTANASADAARQAFRLARDICAQDNGELWGRSLCGPMLLVDRKTRVVFANQPDPQGRLKAQGKIFVGELPTQVNIANTAMEWAGAKWTMLVLPLPSERKLRRSLLAHEMWHRVQDELGFSTAEAGNDHLDTREGRYWLQLEWRALAAALRATGVERTEAIRDALIFRAQRRQIFPTAADSERALEMNEGLAEYTGVKLSGAADLPQFVVEHELKKAPEQPSFVRSFAYATGPAYGLLLDVVRSNWRRNLRKEDDLAALLTQATEFILPPELAAVATESAKRYNGTELATNEEARERERIDRAAAYRARLVDGPVLRIPLQKMNMEFDPGVLVPLDALGTIYPAIRIVDEWGILTVSRGGALLGSDFTSVAVPVPADAETKPLRGDGWELELKPGWEIAPGEREGDYRIRRNE